MAQTANDRLTIRIPRPIKKTLREQARKDGRTLSGWVLHKLVTEALPTQDAPGKA